MSEFLLGVSSILIGIGLVKIVVAFIVMLIEKRKNNVKNKRG